MSEKQLRYAFLIFISVFSVWVMWEGINQIIEINTFLNAKAADTQNQLGEQTIELGTLKITNTKVRDYHNPSQPPQWKMYLSVLNLDHQSPAPLRDNLLLDQTKQNRKIYGVEGHPSFIIHKKDLSFWKWQLYLQTIFYIGGFVIMGILSIIFIETKFKNKKLFITPVKNIILSFALLFLFGMFVKWGIDWRLFNFLNIHYFLGENMPPLSSALLYIGAPTLILGIYVEQAVRLQKEQDLTI